MHVRRIYVKEDVTIPAGHQMDVLIRAIVSNIRIMDGDLISRSKAIHPGIFEAGTVWRKSDLDWKIRVVNVTANRFHLKQRTCLGAQEEVESCIRDALCHVYISEARHDVRAVGAHRDAHIVDALHHRHLSDAQRDAHFIGTHHDVHFSDVPFVYAYSDTHLSV